MTTSTNDLRFPHDPTPAEGEALQRSRTGGRRSVGDLIAVAVADDEGDIAWGALKALARDLNILAAALEGENRTTELTRTQLHEQIAYLSLRADAAVELAFRAAQARRVQ
jgi:hypothetical protein